MLGLVHDLHVLGLHLCESRLLDDAVGDQAISVELGDGGMLLDPLVHDGLGELWFVGFVVTSTSVAPHVDDHIIVEGLAVFDGQPSDPSDGFRIVPIHMEDRRVDHLGDVGSVVATEGVGLLGRETNLVIHDDVERSADGVAIETHHVETFGHDSLAGEGRVAVHQERNDLLAILVVAESLLRPRPSKYDRVHEFQMAGIRSHREANRLSVLGRSVAGIGAVIFHVAGASNEIFFPALGKLGEELSVGLSKDVAEDVQATSMRHSHHEFVDSVGGCEFDDGVEQRDERLSAFDAESFLADVPGLKKGLKRIGRGEHLEQPGPVLVASRWLVGDAFHSLLQPSPLFAVLDMHVLGADVAAIGRLKQVDDRAERCWVFEREYPGIEFLVEMFVAEAEALQGEVLWERAGAIEWIKVGREVADVSVVVDE